MSGLDVLHCQYFEDQRCRSCSSIGIPYGRALSAKALQVEQTLRDVVPPGVWLTPATSPFASFRNRAKFAVGGNTERPTLGITDAQGAGVDLRECGIHELGIWEIVPDLAGFITLTGLMPYDVARRRGSLKYVLVTINPHGELMLRFVVRQRGEAQVISDHLPALLQRLPQILSVSVNVLPEHKAVLEGDEEIHVHGPRFFPFALPHRTLHLHHRSFFQTNTEVCVKLYEQARNWADEVGATSVLDLYCGVGGFALHLAAPDRIVTGVEIEPDAIAAAQLSAAQLPFEERNVQFSLGDATESPFMNEAADFVVVNPPRRGLGEQLCAALDGSSHRHVMYSSCNPDSLATDLRRMPSLRPVSARLFDMFPQTRHSEVAVLLQR